MKQAIAASSDHGVERIRQRRRRELREQLSSTATGLFLERGFDAVTVAEIARVCGVTEKTVFNHFPSKEALLIDRWDDLVETLARRVGQRGDPLVETTISVLDEQLDALTARGHASSADLDQLRSFGEMLRSSPSLIDHRQRELRRLTDTLTTAIAARLDKHSGDLRAQMTAEVLTSLVAVFFARLHHHATQRPTASTLRRDVRRDLRQAADLIRQGLGDQ